MASWCTSTTSSDRRIRRLAILIAVGLSACTTVPRSGYPRPPLPLPKAIAARYAVNAEVNLDYLVPLDDQGRIHRGRLRCGEERPEFHLILPESTPAPLLMCLPILAGGEELMWLIADYMAARGYAVVWSKRVESAMKEHQQPADIDTLFRRTILHNRALLRWGRRQSWARAEATAILGISTGGILGGTLLAIEPDIDAGVLILAGGDLPDLLAHSSESRIARWRRHRQDTDGIDLDQLTARMRESLTSDPARTAAYVPAEKVLMVAAGLDTVVPHRNRELLWEGLGRPTRLQLPVLAHYSAVLGIYAVLAESHEFIRTTLDSSGASRQP